MRVYLWRDRLADGRAGTLAVAVERASDLRAVCAAAGVQRPSRPQPARATDDVVQIALAHPGVLLVLPEGRDPHWKLLREHNSGG